ncbi:DUF86 domain-containing protein [Thermosipho ferrireducens]|uniref:DUF86 domain-containing protein n=1 Tax=Thermosipho ferrireducens TaxID=2571116 RepID=A0ABX7S722_9BACT|nr:DUF86 domain-containing protein [Thermosipho ferrireducens]QTA37585.1 DUF86 domain-containing protein [Thermosipho ferrireducens]
MSKRNAKLFIEDMLDAINKIDRYCKGIKNFEEFEKQEMIVDAVLRNLEIIGEAAGKIPENIRKRYSEIPWKRVVGLRNVGIHGYFAVDLRIIWTIISKQIPELKKMLEKINDEI